jgi:hypothetical protein
MRKLSTLTLGVALVALPFSLTACGGDSHAPPAAQKQEDQSREDTYTKLIATQPVHSMPYSPTRATKNFWIDTWGSKGKVAYVYLRDSQSNVFGYYVLDGLPVSYCTSIIPPYRVETFDGGTDGATVPLLVPGPSVDGTYASSSNCSEFYGKDAVTGAYVEYSVGLGINQQISDQPLPQYGDAQPLGPGTIAKTK